ncbi:hypothetical protein HMPREF9336_02400 [Segniliparus rugosus ATCC BAA-974]|uniref:Uncharacterized protein n=1 Tax=Segniliparus rugosus (strain ATCC BAA-974 / DSM 45345 / CCUG 50838 / CIP 108380 / JCM 13579 / CDC 945) TaxID=679197 RepID=E5XSC8_SEGRC|nr:hypothetical protein HMPREF9336_02400 [Segniliparus rugosus ATCC BAA-974]
MSQIRALGPKAAETCCADPARLATIADVGPQAQEALRLSYEGHSVLRAEPDYSCSYSAITAL